MSEEQEKKEIIVHKLEIDEASLPRRKRHRRKYRKKGLYKKKPTVRRKIKKRWINNQKQIKLIAAIILLVLPIIIALVVALNRYLDFLPWLKMKPGP